MLVQSLPSSNYDRYIQQTSLLSGIVPRVVWVKLVGMVVQICFGSRASISRLVSAMFTVVWVALVGVIVQVSLISSASVATST